LGGRIDFYAWVYTGLCMNALVFIGMHESYQMIEKHTSSCGGEWWKSWGKKYGKCSMAR
jgi:hypothetical protein